MLIYRFQSLLSDASCTATPGEGYRHSLDVGGDVTWRDWDGDDHLAGLGRVGTLHHNVILQSKHQLMTAGMRCGPCSQSDTRDAGSDHQNTS
jgi:hypothetical protein